MTKFSYQLYSSREFPPLSDTLSMLKNLGYAQVEAYGGLFSDLGALNRGLQNNGLEISSGHFGLDMLESDIGRVLEIADKTGMRSVYCPHIAQEFRPTDGPGWREFGRRVQQAGKPVLDAGLNFGWHNHDFEFKQQSDGSLPLEEMFAGGPDLSWEADIAWIVRGGGDPFHWIERYRQRIRAVHIKDIAAEGQCEDEDGWADVGHGTMDWPAIWQALSGSPVRHWVMEHDKPNDHQRFARRSIASVQTYQQ